MKCHGVIHQRQNICPRPTSDFHKQRFWTPVPYKCLGYISYINKYEQRKTHRHRGTERRVIHHMTWDNGLLAGLMGQNLTPPQQIHLAIWVHKKSKWWHGNCLHSEHHGHSLLSQTVSRKWTLTGTAKDNNFSLWALLLMHIKCVTMHFVFRTPHIPASRYMDGGIKIGITFSFLGRKHSINL